MEGGLLDTNGDWSFRLCTIITNVNYKPRHFLKLFFPLCICEAVVAL